MEALRLLSLVYAWAATAILYSTYAEWWGGRVFGPRFLDHRPVRHAKLEAFARLVRHVLPADEVFCESHWSPLLRARFRRLRVAALPAVH